MTILDTHHSMRPLHKTTIAAPEHVVKKKDNNSTDILSNST